MQEKPLVLEGPISLIMLELLSIVFIGLFVEAYFGEGEAFIGAPFGDNPLTLWSLIALVIVNLLVSVVQLRIRSKRLQVEKQRNTKLP